MSNATITYDVTTYTILDGLYEGQITPMAPINDAFARLGQDGNSSQDLGTEGPDSPVSVNYLCANIAAALAAQTAFMALRGKYVTVVEPDGATYDCYVKDVTAMRRGGRFNYGGVLYPARVVARFVFKAQP